MSEPIPQEWKDAVCKILHSGDPGKIKATLRATQDWAATFPDAFFKYTLYEALLRTLSLSGVCGEKKAMTENGTTYAFWFYHDDRKLYGKINLLPCRTIILIYSAHPPLKGEAL